MKGVSTGGVGMYATLIVAILTFLGVDVDEGMATEFVYAIWGVLSFVIWVYGQLNRKDLKYGLFRK